MKSVFCLRIMLALGICSHCQSSTLIVNVIEQPTPENITFICTVSSADNLTRWTHFNAAGSTSTSLISFQDGICKVSPPGSFLTDDKRYSCTCNSTVYQVTIIYNTDHKSIHNHMFSCRDALQPDGTGSTWIIKVIDGSTCEYCDSNIKFDVMDVNEGDNVSFVCRVSSDIAFTNWHRNIMTYNVAMGVKNGTCVTSPSSSYLDNTTEYIYTCNNTVRQVTRLNVQRSEHYYIYMCTPKSMLAGKWSNWIIKVKAPVLSVTLAPAKDHADVTENTAVEFVCTTSTARPAASVYWYIHNLGNNNSITQIKESITTKTDYEDLSVINSTFSFVPDRLHNNMTIFCTANNSINASPVWSNKILMNVLHKADDPYITQGNEYRVIENTSVTLSCSVNGGNPAPALSWGCTKFSPTNQATINSNGNITSTLTWTVLRNHDGTCTCTSQQAGHQNETIDVSLVVLYPPTKPVLKVNGGYAIGAISFIEGTTRRIECTSDSKPPPDRYTWTGLTTHDSVNTQYLTFNTIVKNDAGQYKCSAHNTMNPSSGDSVAGVNTIDVNVVVLYPPVVEPIRNISILEGEELNVSCPYTPGIPGKTSVKWTKNNDDEQWDGEQLLVSSITNSDSGYYSCDASNVMIPSGDDMLYIGNHRQSFYLNVLYAARVTSLTVGGFTSQTVTVHENQTILFICVVDSNPTAVTTLSVESKTKTFKQVTSNNLKYSIETASCLDAGTYVCSARNVHNGDRNAQKEVQMFVNCYPRAAGVTETSIRSEKNKTITLVFNVIAYPPPTFTWWQLVNETWTELNNDDNFNIQSSSLRSNVTIRRVRMEDFTSYKLIVENDVGKMEQLYALSPYDKPDPPTGFRYIESRTTTSSIHLEWKPGFDNGPPQTFFIKFKRSSDTLWIYIDVPDNDKPTMERTLTGLIENTQYEMVILASNEMGNSSESSVLVTTTKAIDKPTNLGPLIVGSVILYIVIIVLIVTRSSMFKGNKADECDLKRSVSKDSDAVDGLVDNPTYESSSNVATTASASPDVYAETPRSNNPSLNCIAYINFDMK